MKNNKNAIIGGLLAIVFVMAVGFAAFSTTLTINGNASITSSWDVHYVVGETAQSNYTVSQGFTGGVKPSAGMTLDGTHATLTADFYQPGDSITYTLTIENSGTLNATLAPSTITSTSCTVSGNTCTTPDGNIKWTVGAPATTSLDSKKTTTMQVTATYVNKDNGNANANEVTATIDLTINATQRTN